MPGFGGGESALLWGELDGDSDGESGDSSSALDRMFAGFGGGDAAAPARQDFAEHFHTLGLRVGGTDPHRPSTPQIRSQRLCIRG